MLPDLRVCPCLEKGGAPRWAAESSRPRILGSVRLAGVGLLITLLSALGYCAQVPGRAMSSRLHAPGLSSLAMLWRFNFYFATCYSPRVVSTAKLIILLL